MGTTKNDEINKLARAVCKAGCCSLIEWEDCDERDGSCPTPKRIANYLYDIGCRIGDKDIHDKLDYIIRKLEGDKDYDTERPRTP